MPGEPANVVDLLRDPPGREYALAELRLAWPDLDGPRERIAARLRLFVITRDPLGWIPERGYAWATVNANGDTLDELVVYVLHAEAQRRIGTSGDAAAAVVAFGEAAIRAGAELEALLASGAYPALAVTGAVPRLLEGLDEEAGPAPASVALRSEGWEPLGRAAVQDLVQEAFGPVDLDRSHVALPRAAQPDAVCPACRGDRFGFPGELGDAQAEMCAVHAAAAGALTEERLARARASNPAGWRAIGKASARTSGLPEALGTPPPPRTTTEPGRIAPCPCGSGRKYKRCCGA